MKDVQCLRLLMDNKNRRNGVMFKNKTGMVIKNGHIVMIPLIGTCLGKKSLTCKMPKFLNFRN